MYNYMIIVLFGMICSCNEKSCASILLHQIYIFLNPTMNSITAAMQPFGLKWIRQMWVSY